MRFEPRVSVIVPAYNEEAVIERCLKSLIGQDYANTQIVVVVGGSDDTYMLSSNFGHGIKVLKESCQGKSAALNEGIAHSDGEIIITTDADSSFPTGWISNLVSYFKNPKVMAVSGGWRAIDASKIFVRCQEVSDIYNQNKKLGIMTGRNSAFRRSAISQVKGFEEGYIGEDADITIRMKREKMELVFDPKILVYTEYPTEIKGFLTQQIRWSQTYLTCVSKYKDVSRVPLWRYFFSAMMLATPFLSTISFPLLTLFAAFFILHLAKRFYILVYVVRKTNRLEYLPCVFLMPLMIVLYYLAHTGAFLQEMFRSKPQHTWKRGRKAEQPN